MVLCPLDFYSSLAQIIDWTSFPNLSVIFSILEGRSPGFVYVDDLKNPQACLIKAEYSYATIGGNYSYQTIEDALEILHLSSEGFTLITPRDKMPLFKGFALESLERIEFLPPPYKPVFLEALMLRLPASVKIKKIDASTIERCKEKYFIEKFYGDIPTFLQKGFGFCLMKENLVISEAYAAFIGQEKVEISIFTDPYYRKNGLSSIVCAAFMEHCYAKNLYPWWTCFALNTASVALAKSLGFQEWRRYFFLKSLSNKKKY